ncbi:MAG TPA: hypothetical protein VE824_02190 [Gaiellales bacterium]|nr:hypothetical protein [Gaiellales bacterium]
MSKRWVIAFQAVGVVAALAVVIGVAVLAGSAAPKAPHSTSHAAAQAAVTQANQHHATFTLPVTINLTAVLAILGCLLALATWAAWQRRHRCHDCGYAPVFCQCELAGSGR